MSASTPIIQEKVISSNETRIRVLYEFERQRQDIDHKRWKEVSTLESADKHYIIFANEIAGLARAYRDNERDISDGTYDMAFAMADRILDFRCPRWVNAELAIKIFAIIGIDRYNGFEPKCLLHLPKTAPLQIGREGSVVIYIKGNHTRLCTKLNASEVSYSKRVNETRIWWD